MSATTNLKFVLTSPGADPDPTPTPTPTPSNPTTTTTTVVGSPNTGDNTTSDNASGTVFPILFILIGVAALAVFLVKYLRKNRHLSFAEKGSFHLSMRPRVFATAGLVLAVAFLGSSILATNFSNQEEIVDAASGELGVSVTSDMTFNVDRGQTGVLTDDVVVANHGGNYKLYVHTDTENFCLQNNTVECLTPTGGDITSQSATNLSALEEGEWGMSLIGVNATSKIWGAVPTKETQIASKDSTSTNTDTVKVNYGVNVTSDFPDGTYTARVIYTAIGDLNYRLTTVNGYVGPSGTNTTNRYDNDVTVYIRQNCPANTTFKGWESDDIDVSIISGPTGTEGLYQFTMPAKDVTVTAICGDLIIKYDANATTYTGSTPDTTVTGPTATLAKNGFTRTGYTFVGWSCKKDATAADYQDGQANVAISELQTKGCPHAAATETTKESYTLYAIWKITEPTYIQDVTPEYCDNMALFAVKTLPDRRVETGTEKSGYTYITDSLGKHVQYSFTKYADGRCWMLQDLAYHPSGSTSLTTTDTDVSENRTVTFATSGTSGALYHTQSSYSTLYNYNAATAGYWSSWSSKAANKVVPDSLCPAHWKIPDASHGPTFNPSTQTTTNDTTYGSESGELYGLWNYNAGQAYGYGKSATKDWKRTFMFSSGTFTTTIGNKTVTYPHFTYNGAWSFSSNNWADTSKGTSGKYASYFLSTTTTDSGSIVPAAYNPHAPGVASDTSDINVTDPAHGSSVRCLLRNADEIKPANRDHAGGATDITENTTN